jgi:hypothetical protein
MQKAGVVKPIHIDTQNQIHQRLPIMEISSSNSSSFPTRPQTAQSVNSANSSRVSVLSRQTQNEPNTAFDQVTLFLKLYDILKFNKKLYFLKLIILFFRF